MTQARTRVTGEMAYLPRQQWESLISAANLGIENTEIARMYFIDQIPQMDIAIEKGIDRGTVSRRVKTARDKIEHTYLNYQRFFKS